MRRDLKDIEVDESVWYEETTRSRDGWRAACREGMKRYSEVQAGSLVVRKEQRSD